MRSTGTGDARDKGLSQGAKTVIKIVRESQGWSEEERSVVNKIRQKMRNVQRLHPHLEHDDVANIVGWPETRLVAKFDKVEEELREFEEWLRWLHDERRSDKEFLELFVPKVIPPILKAADAEVLYENIDQDKDTRSDVVWLLRLAIREKCKVSRFKTIISGLAARLLAPEERGLNMKNLRKDEGTGAGDHQRGTGSKPQTV